MGGQSCPVLAGCKTKACGFREMLIVFHIEQFRFGPANRMCAEVISGVCAFSDLLADELD